MKKLLTVLCAGLLALSLSACSSSTTTTTEASAAPETTTTENEKLVVSATLEPHATILEFVKPILAEKYNIDLEIQVLDDYYIFNKALDAGEVDANYFQHIPFFNQEVADNGYKIVNAGGIHIEPFGFYSKNLTSTDEITEGTKVIVSNSVSDHGRILAILEKEGLITLADGVDAMSATIEDIVEESSVLKKADFTEIKPELLTTAFEQGEGDLVAINGNYAIQAGLNPTKDALILESASQDNPYVNIVACQEGHENDAKIKALVEVLQSQETKDFITSTYSDGSVIPAE